MQKLVNAHATYRKGGILSGFLCHFDLPEPTLQVHTGEVSGTNHAFHGLLHMWQRVDILLGSGVQAMEVDAKLE